MGCPRGKEVGSPPPIRMEGGNGPGGEKQRTNVMEGAQRDCVLANRTSHGGGHGRVRGGSPAKRSWMAPSGLLSATWSLTAPTVRNATCVLWRAFASKDMGSVCGTFGGRLPFLPFALNVDGSFLVLDFVAGKIQENFFRESGFFKDAKNLGFGQMPFQKNIKKHEKNKIFFRFCHVGLSL